jgi:hypothetical protein
MKTPSFRKRRISRTSSAVRIALGCNSPRFRFSGYKQEAFLSPVALLFLATMSAIFFSWVPSHKCAGFTHAGTSQVWQMYASRLILPCLNRNENRCAAHWVLPGGLNAPYPFDTFPAIQSQQPSSLIFRTLSQNLSSTSGETLTDSTVSNTPSEASCMAKTCELLERASRCKREARSSFMWSSYMEASV